MAEEKAASDIQITLTPNQQSTAAKVLSAFPSFKKNKLPDYLRLSKQHIQKLKKWRTKALENIKTPTFSGTFNFTVGAFNLCENVVHCKDVSHTQVIYEDGTDSDFLSDEEDSDDYTGEVNAYVLQWIRSLDQRPEYVESKPKQNLEDIMLNSMAPVMHNLASKELNYKPYKAVEGALEEWISKEMDLRQKQLKLVKQIVGLYEEQEEGEDCSVTEARQSQILELMTKMKDLGELPPEVNEKAQEQFQMNAFADLLPDMMDSMFDGMFAMFEGIGSMATERQDWDKNSNEEGIETMDCVVM